MEHLNISNRKILAGELGIFSTYACVTDRKTIFSFERAGNLTSVFVICLQVKLLAGGKIWGKGVYPVKVTVMEGDLPINANDCGTCVFPQKILTFFTRLLLLGSPCYTIFRTDVPVIKLTSVVRASVLLLNMNFIITLSK